MSGTLFVWMIIVTALVFGVALVLMVAPVYLNLAAALAVI
jgi:hypothetical protein